MIESLIPEAFDALVIINIIFGLLIAGWRFRRDIRGPTPEDAPIWARAVGESADADASSSDS
jgi:hypothetical protein